MTTIEKLDAMRQTMRLEIIADVDGFWVWAYDAEDEKNPVTRGNPDWDRNGLTLEEAVSKAWERYSEDAMR